MAEAEIGYEEFKKKPELIYENNYRHSLTASSYTKQTSLLSNVQGTPVLTEYYRAFLGKDEAPIALQPDSLDVYQSYTRIKGMIIKMPSQFSSDFDEETGTMTLTGSGYVIADLAPIIHDMFIVDIGDGKTAIFTINNPPRITNVVTDRIYEIDFISVGLMTKEIEDNLNAKVVEDLVYSKDSAIRGGSAVLTTNEFNDNKELTKLEVLISRYMIQEFYYNPEKTIVLPDESDVLYDPSLARFLQYTISPRQIGLNDPIEVVGAQFGSLRKGGEKQTVWDMFLQNDFNHPELYEQKYYIHSSDSLINSKYYGGIYFSKIDRVILNVQEGASKNAYRYWTGFMFETDTINNNVNTPKTGIEYDYFFTPEFYTGNPTKENEKFIYSFFRDGVIDKSKLIEILNGYFKAEKLEQLYMGGIYLLAIRIALSTTYRYL